jgi:hypothetical protein
MSCTTPVLPLTPEPGLALRCRTLAWPTLPGALHLLRFGATLDSKPDWNTMLIDTSASLAVAHLLLLQSQPESLTQVHAYHGVCSLNHQFQTCEMPAIHSAMLSLGAQLW